MRSVKTATAAAALAMTCAFGTVAGCSGGSDTAGKSATTSPSSSTASASSTSSASSSTSASSSVNPSANGASAAGVAETDVSKAAATTSVAFKDPYSSGKVKVAVLPLQRRGKLMILTVAFTPTIAAGSERSTASVFSVLSQHLFTPSLIDATNLKKYSVVKSGGVTLQTGETNVSAASGQPMYAWAAFAAPQDNVSALDVQISDAIPRFNSIPIQ